MHFRHPEHGRLNTIQLSNAMGIFPVILALSNELYGLAAVMTLSMLASIHYHLDETNENALLLDSSSCALSSSFLFYLLLNTNVLLTPAVLMCITYSLLAIVFFVMAEEPTSDDYQLYHTAWHVFSVYAASIFVYNYINTKESEGGGGGVTGRLTLPFAAALQDLDLDLAASKLLSFATTFFSSEAAGMAKAEKGQLRTSAGEWGYALPALQTEEHSGSQ